MMFSLLLAIMVAFPRPGMKLPSIDRCYMIGSVEKGVTNLVVAGQRVSVYETGAWATRLAVHPGTNHVRLVATQNGVTREAVRTFFVAPRLSAVPVTTSNARTNAVASKKYLKLPYAADTAKPHPAGRAAQDVTIVIDPGHGGPVDCGARSPHGWCEKDVNLLLAEDVCQALERRGYRVVMTRRTDCAVPLYDRPKVAHQVGADAFVSIHHNAPPAQGDAASVRYSGVYAWNPLGKLLASAIANEMAALSSPGFPAMGVQHARFAVTRNPEIPSCLVEADFITHPAGEAAAWDPVSRAACAEAIAKGIAQWQTQSSEQKSKTSERTP